MTEKTVSPPAAIQSLPGGRYGHLSKLLGRLMIANEDLAIIPGLSRICTVVGCWTGMDGQPQVIVTYADGSLICRNVVDFNLCESEQDIKAAFNAGKKRESQVAAEEKKIRESIEMLSAAAKAETVKQMLSILHETSPDRLASLKSAIRQLESTRSAATEDDGYAQ
jgi:hypothetical protein